MKSDSTTTDSNWIIRRRAKRKGFSMSHRAFQPYGQIKYGMWWFGDKEYRLLSSLKGLSDQKAIEWFDKIKDK